MKRSLLLLFLFSAINLSAQTTYTLTLDEVIELARTESPDRKLAETQLNNRYWRYRSFLADFKPQISLDATLPNLNRSIDPIILPDGSEDFISRALMRNSVNISISQPIAATGGEIFISSGLRRLDIFATDVAPKSLSYLSTPVSIGFFQPLRTFNNLKWRKRIEPISYEEGQRFFQEAKERAATQAAALFFDLLLAQLNLAATEKNKENADTLYANGQGRFEVGRIAETDLLQIELSVQNATAAVAQATLNAQTANEELRSFLGITQNVNFQLIPPSEIPENRVNPDSAQAYALAHRSEILGFERRALEAEAEVDRAIKSNGFQIDVQGQFGLTGTSDVIGGAYSDLISQEVVTLGIRIPIADFGKARSRIEVARSNQELELLNIQQERISFERRVNLAVNQFDLLRNQVALANRAYEVAIRREEITRKRYRIGKISITELNLAIREMDEARQQYIASLRNFWLGNYELRRLTLYDFVRGVPLIIDTQRPRG